MTIDLTCQKCDTSFEMDAAEILNNSEPIQCPHCDAKVPSAAMDDFANALAELCKQVAQLSRRFSMNFSIESDDLPSVYRDEEEAEEDDEEEAEEEDDDLLFDDEEPYEADEDY